MQDKSLLLLLGPHLLGAHLPPQRQPLLTHTAAISLHIGKGVLIPSYPQMQSAYTCSTTSFLGSISMMVLTQFLHDVLMSEYIIIYSISLMMMAF